METVAGCDQGNFLSRLFRASDDLNAVAAVAVDVAAVATAGWFTGFMSSLQRCQFLKVLSYFSQVSLLCFLTSDDTEICREHHTCEGLSLTPPFPISL